MYTHDMTKRYSIAVYVDNTTTQVLCGEFKKVKKPKKKPAKRKPRS